MQKVHCQERDSEDIETEESRNLTIKDRKIYVELDDEEKIAE